MSDETPVNPLKEEADALARIALTNDGLLLHRYLRRVLETVYDTPHDGALRSHNGRRTLARDLMGHMAEGIENRAGSNSADRPILTGARSPVATGGARGSRSRATVTPGDGWSDDTPGSGAT